jgi:cation/acetate symporter
MTLWVLAIYGFNLSNLLGGAVDAANNPAVLNPGLQYGKTETSKLDFMSWAWPWCLARPPCHTC